MTRGGAGREAVRDLLRLLPGVDRLMGRPAVLRVLAGVDPALAASLCRLEVDVLRREILEGGLDAAAIESRVASLHHRIEERLRALLEGTLRPVINATGIVVHTNLGRAPLSPEARRRVERVAAGYSTLEYDLEAGGRGSRQVHAGRLLERLFPERAALAVNNNAAAVLLALNTLADAREVVVSRGELVEIGGSFRVPAILEKSGARLREVGTTNRTTLEDYRSALSPETGALLKVWPSNYRIVGFTAAAGVAELAALGREAGVPLVVDQGCGALVDLSPWGVPGEPAAAALLGEGADLVCFSGDKLLGGPQAGVIVGRPDLVDRCRRNPLARAVRCDKMTLAALEATLAAWVAGRAAAEVPVARMLATGAEELRRRADDLAGALRVAAPSANVEVLPGASRVGGGAAPEVDLPTAVVALAIPGIAPGSLERRLRAADPPVIARVSGGRLLLDPRTLQEGEAALVVRAVGRIAAAAGEEVAPGAPSGESEDAP